MLRSMRRGWPCQAGRLKNDAVYSVSAWSNDSSLLLSVKEMQIPRLQRPGELEGKREYGAFVDEEDCPKTGLAPLRTALLTSG